MPRILIVEDDIELARAVSRWLKLEGFIVEVAPNGEEGNYLLDTVTFDAVILDRNLPDVEGLDILKRLRKRKLDCPVLFLTGKDSLDDKLEGLDSGADDYLTKPFHGKELIMRIKALLRRPAKIVNGNLIAGCLELIPERRSVKRGEDEIKLVEREFALLEFFMRHPNELFPSARLINQIWAGELDAGNDALTSCLKRLRKKIDIEGQDSFIQNVHGVGYGLLMK